MLQVFNSVYNVAIYNYPVGNLAEGVACDSKRRKLELFGLWICKIGGLRTLAVHRPKKVQPQTANLIRPSQDFGQ